MAEEKKEKWLTFLSLSTVIIAVCATLSTFKGGGYSTKSLISQAKASDQWSFYQSKSIKSYMYEMQRTDLEMQVKASATPSINPDLQKLIESYSEKIKKYESEKEEISKEAKSYEQMRDECKAHSERFGMAVIFLQVSILLSSVSALTKRKMLWYFSMAVGAVGIVYFLNGFWVFL